MGEDVLQVTGDEVEVTENQVEVTKGELKHVESHVFIAHTEREVGASGIFTRGAFEDALDKVSRPVKGKYAAILPSSEEFIKDKRTEVELEERSS